MSERTQRVSDEAVAKWVVDIDRDKARGETLLSDSLVVLDLRDSRAEVKRLREALRTALNAVDPPPGRINLVTREEWITKARAALGEP